MKKLLLSLSVVALSVATMYGQGRVSFNNFASAGVTVSTGNQGSAGAAGTAGQFIGANYSVQLLWAPSAVYANEAAFNAAVVGSSPATGFAFFGATGGTPGTDGAGLFDGATVPNPIGTSMPAGTYTMAARAWYNNATFTTYAAAQAASKNTGFVMFTQAVNAPPAGITTTAVPAFQVGLVPEPSTLALAGIGAAMLLFRRKK
jgi:hypothetical protein